MDTVVKAFMSLFLIIFFTLISLGIISSSIATHNAEDLASNAVLLVEAGNFSDVAKNAAINLKDSNEVYQGYDVTIESGDKNHDGLDDYAVIKVDYPIKVPVISLVLNNTITQYAR